MEVFTKHQLADMIFRPLDGVMPSAELRRRLVEKQLNQSDLELIKTFKRSLNMQVVRLSDNKFIIQY